MPGKQNPRLARRRRHHRVRTLVAGSPQRPRLCVFRSLHHIYVQLIDDSSGHTLASASNLDREYGTQKSDGTLTKTEAARVVGALIAQRAKAQGITQVVFDRGGYKYHGRVKALAEAARQGGLKF
ncbi:MAG: 50S ribosomal protein L18 [Dehalococcoidia bacterium]